MEPILCEKSKNGFFFSVPCCGEVHSVFLHNNYSIAVPNHNIAVEMFAIKNFGAAALPCMSVYLELSDYSMYNPQYSLNFYFHHPLLEEMRQNKKIEIIKRIADSRYTTIHEWRSELHQEYLSSRNKRVLLTTLSIASDVLHNVEGFEHMGIGISAGDVYSIPNTYLLIPRNWIDTYRKNKGLYRGRFVVKMSKGYIDVLEKNSSGNPLVKRYYV